jgi:hypothetical protein
VQCVGSAVARLLVLSRSAHSDTIHTTYVLLCTSLCVERAHVAAVAVAAAAAVTAADYRMSGAMRWRRVYI